MLHCTVVLTMQLNALGQRISEVKYRDDELNRSLEANKLETEAAVEMRARIDKMIEALQELLHISQQCLVKRSADVYILLTDIDYNITERLPLLHVSCNILRPAYSCFQ